MNSLIFHGRRSIQLQKFRHLIVSVKPSSFSSSFSSAFVSRQEGKIFNVSYLVDSLGLTRKLAESISRKVSSEAKGNPDSVLNLLTSHGFTDSQISSVITSYPRFLMLDAEKSLGPKLEFLQSRGASTSELAEVVSKVPKILGKREDKTIGVYYDFVKEIIEADKSSKKVKLSHSLPEGCKQENKIRNVLTLRELGMPQELLFSLFISDYGPVHGKEKFEESLKKIIEMGFDPKTSKFVEALCVVYQLSDKTLEEKVEVYKRLGFDVGDVWSVFRKHPIALRLSEKKILNTTETFLGLGFSRDEFVMIVKHYPTCLNLSAETVKKKIEFLVKTMNWPFKILVSNPQVLALSTEKRIIPRCNVVKALMSKGLLGSGIPSMRSVLVCTDQLFLERYVTKHDDKQLVSQLMAIFSGDRVSLNVQG